MFFSIIILVIAIVIWIIFNNKTKQKSQNANSQLNQASHHSRTKEIRTVLQPKIADSVVIDTETIGYGNDLRIIEIGAVFLQNKKIIKTYTQLINPKQPISSITRQLTGITDKDLEKQPEAQEIIPMFLQSIRQLTIIGHNISYDINALNYEAQRLNILPIKNTSIVDTMALAKEKIPNAGSYSLQEVLTLLGIHQKEKHRALSDALQTFLCWEKLIKTQKPIELNLTEYRESKQRAKRVQQEKAKIFAKASYLSQRDTKPINPQPQGKVIVTLDCGVDINGELNHQEKLKKYGYDAWLWVFVMQGTIKKGKFAGYPTYWVYLDGEEIGHITKYQMERHYGQIPKEGAVMIAHIPNKKNDIQRRQYQLRLQMPTEHEPQDLTNMVIAIKEEKQNIKTKITAHEFIVKNERKPIGHQPEKNVTFINKKPHKKVLLGEKWQKYTVDTTSGSVDFSDIESGVHFWGTAKTEKQNIIIRFQGRIVGVVLNPPTINKIDTPLVVEGMIDRKKGKEEIFVYLPNGYN